MDEVGEVRVPALMRANRPKSSENGECLGAQSKLTTAGDTGENAVCPEAQSINKFHGNCLRVPRGTAMGTGSPAIRQLNFGANFCSHPETRF